MALLPTLLCFALACVASCEGILDFACQSSLEEGETCASTATVLLQTHHEVRRSGVQLASSEYESKPSSQADREAYFVKERHEKPKLVGEHVRKLVNSLAHKPPTKTGLIVLTREGNIKIAVTCAVFFLIAVIGVLPEWRFQSSKSEQSALPKAADLLTTRDAIDPGAFQKIDHLEGGGLPELHEAIAKGGGIAALVEARAQERPDHDALVDARDGSSISYRQLDASVKALAKSFALAGLVEQDVVAVFLSQSPGLIVALLALMRANIVWLAMDPETPAARMQHLLQSSRTRLALCPEGAEPLKTLADVPAWSISQKGDLATASPSPPRLAPSDGSVCSAGTAAIFFTSGSTGMPKGVMYGAETLLHGVLCMKKLCSMDHSTVAILKTPVIWAVLEYEAFPALVAGGTVVCDDTCQKDLQRLAQLVSDYKVTTLMTSAPVLKAEVEGPWSQNPDLLQAAAGSLKDVLNVGGAMPLEVCASTQAALPQTKIHNLYGCTECICTQWTYGQASSSGEGNAPAGRPQPECTAYILGPDQKPVAPGEVGEIFLGSPFNSLGYLGDKELTSTKFLSNEQGTRYRTGDLGALVPDKNGQGGLVLEVTGRADRQLNISGVRVAPEEVESAIMNVEGVVEVAVVQGGKSIVAFFLGKTKDEDLKKRIQDHCVEQLLSRMRPALLLQLEEFPRLRNGKVDLKALTARAEEAAGESLVQATDSLGLMKSVSKDALLEVHALAAMRGLAMLEVFLFHMWWSEYAFAQSSNMISPAFREDVSSPLVRWFMRGNMQSQWAMCAFIVISARTDRQASEERRPGQVREMVLVWAMMLFAFWPLPQLVQMLYTALGNDVQVTAHASMGRWYLLLWLQCKFMSTYVMLPIERFFQRSGNLGTALRALLVMSCFQYTYYGGHWLPTMPCDSETTLGRFFRWNVPTAGQGDFLENCHSMYFVYIAAWFYQRQIVAAVWKRWPTNLGPAVPLLIFVGCTTVLGMTDDIKEPMWLWTYGQYTMLEMGIACCFVGFCCLGLYQLAAGPWLNRLGLLAMGNCSLGTYIVHSFFCPWVPAAKVNPVYFGIKGYHLPWMVDIIAAAGTWAGGVGQLIAWLAYPMIFSLTFGYFFQKAFLSSFTSIERGVMRIVRALPLPNICTGK